MLLSATVTALTPTRLLAAALLCCGLGALFAGGPGALLLLPGLGFAIAALARGAEGPSRRILRSTRMLG